MDQKWHETNCFQGLHFSQSVIKCHKIGNNRIELLSSESFQLMENYNAVQGISYLGLWATKCGPKLGQKG